MSKPKLIIYGNGSMAKVYSMYLQDHFDVVAYTVQSKLLNQNTFNGKSLIAFEDIESHFAADSVSMVIAVGYSDLNSLREKLALEAVEKGFKLISYVSPTIKLDSDFEIGSNSLILDHGSVHTGTKVGNNVFISSGVHIGHDCEIGDNVWINAGVSIGGGTKISANSFVGMNATVSHGITVGKKNFIGAATLVTKNSDDNKVIISSAGEELPMASETFIRFSRAMNNG